MKCLRGNTNTVVKGKDNFLRKSEKGDYKSQYPNGKRPVVATAAGLLAVKSNKCFCIFCKQNHDSAVCAKAKEMSFENRSKLAKENNACFYCLKLQNGCKSCHYKGKCEWCGGRHVLIMCRKLSNNKPNVEQNNRDKEGNKSLVQDSLANISLSCEVFLQTLRVRLVNDGKKQVVRAILDTGSHRSYILEDFANKLGYKVVGEPPVTHSLFSDKKTEPQPHRGYRVYLNSVNNKYACNFVA